MSPPVGHLLLSQTEQQTHEAKEAKETLLELQNSAFGHAQTYTTVVIFGGYAGMFAIWSFTRDSLSSQMNSWVGLLLGVSLLIFVLHEIFGMIMRAKEFLATRKLLIAGLPPAQFLTELRELKRKSSLRIQRIVLPIWIGALVLTVATGVSGAIILLYAFGTTLFAGVPEL